MLCHSRLLAVPALLLAVCHFALARTSKASLKVLVSGSSGGIIAGASISSSIRNAEPSSRTEPPPRANSCFPFDPRIYSLEVTAPGFAPFLGSRFCWKSARPERWMSC
jgi:hypothetical protein